MPSKYGSYVTAWRRLRRLQEASVWGKIMDFSSSMRSYGCVAIDSKTVEAKRGWAGSYTYRLRSIIDYHVNHSPPPMLEPIIPHSLRKHI